MVGDKHLFDQAFGVEAVMIIVATSVGYLLGPREFCRQEETEKEPSGFEHAGYLSE